MCVSKKCNVCGGIGTIRTLKPTGLEWLGIFQYEDVACPKCLGTEVTYVLSDVQKKGETQPPDV